MRARAVEDIGVIARQRRQDLRLSQGELAERSGVTRQWLTRFERGNSEVSLSKVFAILRELELTVRIDTIESTDSAVGAPTSIVFDIPRVEMPVITAPNTKPSAMPLNDPELVSGIRDRITALQKSHDSDWL